MSHLQIITIVQIILIVPLISNAHCICLGLRYLNLRKASKNHSKKPKLRRVWSTCENCKLHYNHEMFDGDLLRHDRIDQIPGQTYSIDMCVRYGGRELT